RLCKGGRRRSAPWGSPAPSVPGAARGGGPRARDNGTEVLGGRDEARARLQRFVRVLPQLLAAQARPLDRADLRYTNGFTLAWGQPRTSSNPPALPRPLAARTRAAQASST